MFWHLDVLPSEEAGVYRPFAGPNHCQCGAESCPYQVRGTRESIKVDECEKPCACRTSGGRSSNCTRRTSPGVAKEALERIAALYAIEDAIRGRSAEERRAVRNERSKPLLESLKKWFEETLGKLSKKSGTTKAIRYALGRWNELMRFCDDGHLEIDNSAAERSLRTVVLGRKNYLFHGSDAGGERAAAIYGLIGTAKLN